MQIIYEDNHLFVIDKPHGVATQPDLEEMGKAYIKKRDGKPGGVFLHAVHRLDKSVGGVVVCAKTSKALKRLMRDQREKKWHKWYIARIEGTLQEEQGVFRDTLVKKAYKAEVALEGKVSELAFYRLEKDMVEIRLHTGRYHQIRVQFASRGTPIVGDIKYGAKKSYRGGIALMHKKVQLMHPITGQWCIFRSRRTI